MAIVFSEKWWQQNSRLRAAPSHKPRSIVIRTEMSDMVLLDNSWHTRTSHINLILKTWIQLNLSLCNTISIDYTCIIKVSKATESKNSIQAILTWHRDVRIAGGRHSSKCLYAIINKMRLKDHSTTFQLKLTFNDEMYDFCIQLIPTTGDNHPDTLTSNLGDWLCGAQWETLG